MEGGHERSINLPFHTHILKTDNFLLFEFGFSSDLDNTQFAFYLASP